MLVAVNFITTINNRHSTGISYYETAGNMLSFLITTMLVAGSIVVLVGDRKLSVL